MKKGNPKALIPILVFLVLYLGLGILFEYVLQIPMGFYNIPIVVIFLVALLVACLQNRGLNLDAKIGLMGKGAGDKTIMYMIIIFMVAGIFVGTVGRGSAESVAYWLLSLVPGEWSPAIMFVVACFVSLAMGTSVGTITLLTPIAYAIADGSGISLAFIIGSVMGGAMFGDNLSFISDTTIAACQGQGCDMKDKFRANFKIALPAALLTLVVIIVISLTSGPAEVVSHEFNLIEVIPYVLVLVTALVGINVFVALLVGIVSGAVIMLATGAYTATGLLAGMGAGAAGMFETTMVAILVSCIGALVREYGGFDALLYAIRKVCKGKKSGELGMGLVVGAMDIATANNTVAIVMSNP
ncbi:MAG: Na+/H+ antiporter NhaC family protein, partial [Eggerthellaceae bacterium]|nr:Na+/H+ antiporter NhaC family protein [Eggerthellaceae bacterium]